MRVWPFFLFQKKCFSLRKKIVQVRDSRQKSKAAEGRERYLGEKGKKGKNWCPLIYYHCSRRAPWLWPALLEDPKLAFRPKPMQQCRSNQSRRQMQKGDKEKGDIFRYKFVAIFSNFLLSFLLFQAEISDAFSNSPIGDGAQSDEGQGLQEVRLEQGGHPAGGRGGLQDGMRWHPFWDEKGGERPGKKDGKSLLIKLSFLTQSRSGVFWGGWAKERN